MLISISSLLLNNKVSDIGRIFGSTYGCILCVFFFWGSGHGSYMDTDPFVLFVPMMIPGGISGGSDRLLKPRWSMLCLPFNSSPSPAIKPVDGNHQEMRWSAPSWGCGWQPSLCSRWSRRPWCSLELQLELHPSVYWNPNHSRLASDGWPMRESARSPSLPSALKIFF